MRKNILEWLVFGASVILIALVAGALVVDMIKNPGDAPKIVTTKGSMQRVGEHYRLHVRVENRGGTTAEGVVVEGTLKPLDGEEETSTFEIAFVPRQSRREGWLTFSSDPSTGELRVRAIGYEKP